MRFAQSDFLLIAGLAALGVLVSSRKALGYLNGKPFDLELAGIGDGCSLEVEAAKAFNAMRGAASNDGVLIRPKGPRSAFRTWDMQAEMKEENPAPGAAASPGYSKHQEGHAVDVDLVPPGVLSWLGRYARTYGFWSPYPSKEPWHWEFKP